LTKTEESVPFCSDIRTVSKNAKLSGNYFSPYYLLREKENLGNVFQKYLNYFIAVQNPAWFWAQKNRKPFLDFLSLAAADGRRLFCYHSPEANL
jgi:hypothetical protein